MREYYDRRAHEYDDWYLGRGLFATRDRPGWQEELDELIRAVAALPAGRTIDVACGTGFLTQHLRGDVLGVDQSESMLEEARLRSPQATFLLADAFALPVPDGSFDRVFTAHFYGHLHEGERDAFLAESRRVAPQLVVVDSSRAGSDEDEAVQERVLEDGSRWQVYKRWFTPGGLLDEIGGGTTLFSGRWFVAVSSS